MKPLSRSTTRDDLTVLDYARSYLSWSVPANLDDTRVPGHKPWGNAARILLDGRCRIIDNASDWSDDFYLVNPCRTEWMYQEENLFQIPNREWIGVWSKRRKMPFRTHQVYSGEALNHSSPTEGVYNYLRFEVRGLTKCRELHSDEEVIEATLAGYPLVACTKITRNDGAVTALIEYPVKTMNINPDYKRFQVDTGPLLLPDLSSTREHTIEWFSLAHTIYNRFDRAEFIRLVPTSVDVQGRNIEVMDYSEVYKTQAENRLFAEIVQDHD